MERVKFSALEVDTKFIMDGYVWFKKAEGYAMCKHLGNCVKIEADEEVIRISGPSDFMPVAFFDGKIYVLEESRGGKVPIKEFSSVDELLIAHAKKEVRPDYIRGLI